jgi:4-amino-4-deoxy-L-arabinose transferase-like glycosyltransferase
MIPLGRQARRDPEDPPGQAIEVEGADVDRDRPGESPPRRPGARAVVRAAAGLLAIHVGLLLAGLRLNFITVDEVASLAAGVSYWRTGRFFAYRVNPPLTKLLSALPALAAGARADFRDLRDSPGTRAEYGAGHAFLEANRSRLFDLVCLARLPGLAWSALGGGLVFLWARRLYGGAAGCFALALWCVEPLVLGHAPLVTTDVPAAVAGLAASFAFWRYLRAPTWRGAGAAGVLLGLAGLTKFTLLLLFALWPLLWMLDRRLGRADARSSPGRLAEGGQLLLIAALGLYVINWGYLFRGSLRPLGDYPFVSRALAGQSAGGGSPGNRFKGHWLGAVPVPLPEDVLRGIDTQQVDFEARMRSYLAGRWRREGWWYYYLYGLAVKLPLGTIALVLWGAASALGARGPSRRDEAFLLATAATFLALVSAQTGFSHHLRYAIPALPYLLIVAAGLAGPRPGRPRWAGPLAWALLLGAAGSSLAVAPHWLSYFNEAAGGPANGHAHLLDSNIDWGQDLLSLRSWLRDHPEARPLGLAYFNSVDPGLVGIDYRLPPPGREALAPGQRPDQGPVGPRPGYFAVSVNFLRGFEFLIADGRGGMHQVRPHEYEYFRAFRPIARAGYSIYIYHITPRDCDAVRRSLGLPALDDWPAPRRSGL